jgi:alginate O-acetyltransferase complex protein AlgI
MVFSSVIFLAYILPVFLLVYHILPHKLRNYWVLLVSIVFYAWGAPEFIFVVAGTIAVDFYIVKKMHRSENERLRKYLLTLSVVMKIGLLVYFKYINFLIDNINAVFTTFGGENIHWVKVALPIGISFFIFQAVTYSVDVYRKVCPPLKNISDYLMYILLFPQLIAGPIVRYNTISDQITDRKANETIDNKLLGLYRFVIGLSKKLLIANVLGAEADLVFGMGQAQLTTEAAWVGILAYTFQIYFDFSGYSDMAIGLGRMMGFTFPENFNNPYISQSITEFWRRWHITLGQWMRDYLYIPLGGNRVSVRRVYFNLWLVFLVSGLWHGAAWNFVLWGAFHGLFLVLDRLFLLKFYSRIGKYPSIILTFFITIIGWVIFRAESMHQIGYYLGTMFSWKTNNLMFHPNNKFVFIIIIAFIFSFITLFKWGLKTEHFFFHREQMSSKQHLFTFVLILILFVLSYSAMVSTGFNPFIYFRF